MLIRLTVLMLAVIVAVDVSADTVRERAVLVTGASSGIGLNITRQLAANGYFVYAGARKQADLDRLDAMDGVQGLRLDVTYPEDIEAAVATVKEDGRGLHALVNNAGVAIIGPLVETPLEDVEWLFDVNVYGPYRVTAAFAPLLIDSGGRVVNISSISGILSSGLLGQYSMSKHALEAYTDALAAELGPFGVQVSAVEPGNFNSNIGAVIAQRMDDSDMDLENSRYADRLQAIRASVADRDRYREPDAVGAAVLAAIGDPAPRRRYMVTPDQRSAEITIRKAIEELVELNGGHAHSYERDALVQMLDEALQRERLAATAGLP